jgi:hypothetical protein
MDSEEELMVQSNVLAAISWAGRIAAEVCGFFKLPDQFGARPSSRILSSMMPLIAPGVYHANSYALEGTFG